MFAFSFRLLLAQEINHHHFSETDSNYPQPRIENDQHYKNYEERRICDNTEWYVKTVLCFTSGQDFIYLKQSLQNKYKNKKLLEW